MDDVTSSFGAVPNSAILNFSTPTSPYLRKLSLYAVAPSRIMAVGLTNGRHAADEEARAEVDVLNSRLEKTAQLTKKIQASLTKLEASGKSVREVVGPLNGETKRLQTLGHNIDAVIAAIERLRGPADSKNDEEQIIRAGPEKAGLSNYLQSIKRLNKALADMKASNLRANQQTIADLQRMIKSGNSQLERHFEKLLQGGTPRSVEPLHFITKQKPFPVLSQDKITRLGLVHSYVGGIYRENMGGVGTPQESPAAKIYAEIRGPYLTATLSNLATASVSTAKKKDANAIYRAGTNGMGTYAQAMEGLFLAEYDNICSIFLREDWGPVFQATCQGALAELARTVRELNAHVKAHMSTDACLAYEIVEILSTLSNNLETRTGELKASLAATLRPVRETAKASLGELLDDIRRRVSALPTLPPDGAPVPVISETMQRLQAMVEFLRPISSIMISIGDGGWKSSASRSNAGAGLDGIPSLASFDVGADGRDIFAHFCADAIDTLLGALDARARAVHMGRSGGGIVGGVSVVGGVVGGGSGPSGGSLVAAKAVVGVFLANAVVIVERQVRDSDLAPLLLDSSGRLPVLEGWRKKATALYADGCKDVSTHLFDVIHTSRPTGGGGGAGRPTSGQGAGGIDSASILRGLSSKDKENIKNKFAAFNSGFDDLVARHKSYSMEREVRQLFARDVQQMLEPLYNRFWDRYHEIDKGKGKYVKYDRSSIAAVFLSLY